MLYPAKPHLCREREQLHSIPIPVRDNVSDRWCGIPHGEFADLIVRQAEGLGLIIEKEQWQINPDAADLFGSLDFKLGSTWVGPDYEAPEGMGFSFGVRHSNKSRYAATIVSGAHVFVCANGMITGETAVSRRHTTNMRHDLPFLIHCGIEKAIHTLGTGLVADVKELRERDLSRWEADDLLLKAGREGVVSWSQLGKVDKLWREPPHPEFEDRNAWSFYNAFTEVAKDFTARHQMDTIRDARKLCLSTN